MIKYSICCALLCCSMVCPQPFEIEGSDSYRKESHCTRWACGVVVTAGVAAGMGVLGNWCSNFSHDLVTEQCRSYDVLFSYDVVRAAEAKQMCCEEFSD